MMDKIAEARLRMRNGTVSMGASNCTYPAELVEKFGDVRMNWAPGIARGLAKARNGGNVWFAHASSLEMARLRELSQGEAYPPPPAAKVTVSDITSQISVSQMDSVLAWKNTARIESAPRVAAELEWLGPQLIIKLANGQEFRGIFAETTGTR